MIRKLLISIILNIIIIMLSRRKQKETAPAPRPQLGMNSIKLNNFLFKKQKQKLAESMEVPTMRKQQLNHEANNKSLRIRFKSQIIQFKQAPDSISSKNSTCFPSTKEPPNNLTLRILKWSKLKNKNEGNRFDYHLFKDKIRGDKMAQKSDIEIINLRKSSHNSLQRKRKLFSNQSETMKIIDSYKLTQKIVFYEQLQQKKDKQRYAQDPHKKLQPSKHFEEGRSGGRLFSEKEQPGRVCRPWSGQSIHSEAHQE